MLSQRARARISQTGLFAYRETCVRTHLHTSRAVEYLARRARTRGSGVKHSGAYVTLFAGDMGVSGLNIGFYIVGAHEQALGNV